MSDPAPHIDGHDILGEVSCGPASVVYKARSIATDRVVAIEVVSGEADPKRKQHAEAAAKVKHPNLVPVQSVGVADGRLFLVREFRDGSRLAHRFGGRILPAQDAAAIIEPIAAALAVAHRQGVIHGDLTANRIFLASAKQKGEATVRAGLGLVPFVDGLGACGAGASAAEHIRAIGVLLHELLTGKSPTETPQLPADCPAALSAICLRCLGQPPHRSYGRMAAVADDLRRFLGVVTPGPASAPARSSRWRTALLPLAGIIALVAVVVLGVQAIPHLMLPGTPEGPRPATRPEPPHNPPDAAVKLPDRSPQDEPGASPLVLETPLIRRTISFQKYNLFACSGSFVAWVDTRDRPWIAGEHGLMESFRFPVPEGLRTLALSPAERKLALGGANELRVVDAFTGEQFSRWPTPQPVDRVIFSPDRKQLVAGVGSDIVFWDLRGKELRRLRGHTARVMSLAMSFDGRTLASSASDGSTRLWQLDRNESVPLPGNESRWFEFTPDGMTLASVQEQHGVALWESPSARRRHLIDAVGKVQAAAISPDGRMLATSGEEPLVHVWSLVTGKEIGRCVGRSGTAMALTFHPRDHKLTSLMEDGVLLVWDLTEVRKKAIPTQELKREEAGKMWELLGDRDPEKAYTAAAALAGSPEETLALFDRELRPAAPIDLRAIVEALGDERERFPDLAMRALAEAAELAEPLLRERRTTASGEMKKRIDKLLERLKGPVTDPSRLQPLRALEVLGHIDRPAAAEKIKQLAGGAPEALLTRHAQALRRLQLRDLDLFDD